MEERKIPGLPGSSVEKNLWKRNRRLSFDERHFESCSPSSTTPGPRRCNWGDGHLKFPLPLGFACVVVYLSTSEGFGCPEQRTLGQCSMWPIGQFTKGISLQDPHASEGL